LQSQKSAQALLKNLYNGLTLLKVKLHSKSKGLKIAKVTVAFIARQIFKGVILKFLKPMRLSFK